MTDLTPEQRRARPMPKVEYIEFRGMKFPKPRIVEGLPCDLLMLGANGTFAALVEGKIISGVIPE